MGVENCNWHLDSAFDQWVALPLSGQRPSTRYKHAAAISGDKLYISGGSRNGWYLSDVQVLDLKALAWSTLKLNPEPNAVKDGLSPETLPATSGHSMFTWENKLLLIGGHSKNVSYTITGISSMGCSGYIWKSPGGEGRNRQLLNDIHVLNLDSMTWEALETK